MTLCNKGCGTEIEFSDAYKTNKGVMIPCVKNNDTGGLEPHQCPKSDYKSKNYGQNSTISKPKSNETFVGLTDEEKKNTYSLDRLGSLQYCRKLAVSFLQENNGELTGNNVAYTTNMFVQLVNTENTISAIHRTIPLKQETFSAEIDNSEKSSDGRATLELYSHAELPTEIENVNAKNTVGSNVRGLIANLPSIFSKKLSGNEKLRIYYQIVFGIDITLLQKHSAESVLRTFRKELEPEVKHYDQEDKFKKHFSRKKIYDQGGLLLD
jgi:hypothetical protein